MKQCCSYSKTLNPPWHFDLVFAIVLKNLKEILLPSQFRILEINTVFFGIFSISLRKKKSETG